MSIDFDPIIFDIVVNAVFPVIKLDSGLYVTCINIIPTPGDETKMTLYYGSYKTVQTMNVYGTVTQYTWNGFRWTTDDSGGGDIVT